MVLVTSNKVKLKEFQRIFTDIKAMSSLDIKEVKGTSEDVITYKALEVGGGYLVEDTILVIEGEEVVDIKWRIKELKEKKYHLKNCIKASWQVMLGYNTGENIELYKGTINGIIISDSTDKGYGFDPYFLPDGSDITLAKLEDLGEKDLFSARYKAIVDLKHKKIYKKIKIKDIPKWKGEYQNDR